MVEPQYQELKSQEIPKPSQDGVIVAVISGEALGVKVRRAAVCACSDQQLAPSGSSALTGLPQFMSCGANLPPRCQHK